MSQSKYITHGSLEDYGDRPLWTNVIWEQRVPSLIHWMTSRRALLRAQGDLIHWIGHTLYSAILPTKLLRSSGYIQETWEIFNTASYRLYSLGLLVWMLVILTFLSLVRGRRKLKRFVGASGFVRQSTSEARTIFGQWIRKEVPTYRAVFLERFSQ